MARISESGLADTDGVSDTSIRRAFVLHMRSERIRIRKLEALGHLKSIDSLENIEFGGVTRTILRYYVSCV